MTAGPVQIRHRAIPVCKECQHPIRLAASLQTGVCCHCRHRCGLDPDLGCLVCSVVITGLQAQLGLCIACQVIAS